MVKPTTQQMEFVERYIEGRCRNAKQAAIDAGYSAKTAYAQASTLLKKPGIAALVEQRREELRKKVQQEFIFDAITAKQVLYDVLQSPTATDRDRITAAKDFLDRAGFKAPDKIEHSGSVNNPFADLTAAELKKLARIAYDDA